MAVSVISVRSACFDDTIKLSGHIVPRAEVFVRPEVEGYHVNKVLVEDGETVHVNKVLVEDGETVHVGQKLAELVKPAGGPRF